METKYLILGAVVVLVLLVAAAAAGAAVFFGYFQFQPAPTIKLIPPEKACTQDADCECGVRVGTGDCFYGNKNYVNASQQCPDYCTGIAGNLRISCVAGMCAQIII